jgi:methylphosphotriester-DNA--protein-cysteine methyltransferase
MIYHTDISSRILFRKIKNKQLALAGNKKLKIYGTLDCTSGKRMKKENRVFFFSEEGATKRGYRPCGNCLKIKYNDWKRQQSD